MAANNQEKQRFVPINTENIINTWFSKHLNDNPDSLRQNKVWLALRKGMTIMGHYKNKARGKPDAKYFQN